MSTVELACAMLLVVPIALFAVNIGFLSVVSFVNDAACREAARVAAEQTSLPAALAAARAVVKSFAIAGGLVSSPRVDGVTFKFFTDNDGNPIEIRNLTQDSLSKLPKVEVVTKLVARAPAPMFIGASGLVSSITMTSTYTFPVLHGIDTNPGGTEGESGEGDDVPDVPDNIDINPPEDTSDAP